MHVLADAISVKNCTSNFVVILHRVQTQSTRFVPLSHPLISRTLRWISAVKPNVVVLNTVISACAKCGQIDQATELLRDMQVTKFETGCFDVLELTPVRYQCAHTSVHFSIVDDMAAMDAGECSRPLDCLSQRRLTRNLGVRLKRTLLYSSDQWVHGSTPLGNSSEFPSSQAANTYRTVVSYFAPFAL